MADIASLKHDFRELHGGDARIFRAPGRVNLIGEHTDYNDGFVLPAAISFATFIAAAPRPDRRVHLFSANLAEEAEFDLDEPSPSKRNHWSDYPRGVAVVLRDAGYKIGGADLLIDGEVPLGSGLSSSAALELSTAFALVSLAGVPINRVELARLCQRAENEFVGIRSGIMDQLISACGQAGHALLIDCRTLEFRPYRTPEAESIVICNTMVRHELAAGEYNRRRAECEEAVAWLRRSLPGVTALRDVSESEFDQFAQGMPEVAFRRARHVVRENARVLRACVALDTGDLGAFGRLMNQSHESLRDDYEVSCTELDVMVEAALAAPGVRGARMTGGGFGGCTVNLVDSAAVDEFTAHVSATYQDRTGGIRPEIYVSSAAEGAGEVQA